MGRRSRVPVSPRLATATWEALGTTVLLRVEEASALPWARSAVEAEIDRIDLACSRFRPDSELSQLNASAGRGRRVGPVLLEAMELALRAAALTDGDVDPTVGRALELAGYDRDWTLLDPPRGEHQPMPIVTARVRAGWQAVTLDRENSSITLPAGIKIDLGATAKAWAADRAAAAAALAGDCGALVGIGGDIATAGALRATDGRSG